MINKLGDKNLPFKELWDLRNELIHSSNFVEIRLNDIYLYLSILQSLFTANLDSNSRLNEYKAKFKIDHGIKIKNN